MFNTKILYHTIRNGESDVLMKIYRSNGENFVKEVYHLYRNGYIRTYQGNFIFGGDNALPIDIIDATAFEVII
ncbi:hypothetical protein NDS46_30090 (plasmid) [Paenibacillus thiaminolyticus]|uniref:hypothetical protein n=1 Tax=Paenibacillus thiaminolyticus TaxID=49283 RepID=UPI00232F7663|nr:hypothetical protein [Paenibacillus thiaminolyticus]WCF11598.1 hypothetical protein NDS46_30090 [Paenibacillus thiaminolyticus]